ncbi:hypothetical protein [Mycetocola zhujimingii]|uniref:hypothetical protein n=1 Tax=Mycetocola zhujimingii TaxID=2079792 RepID=UPI0018E0B55D|nr:hypothetical protein [Mycetocola zhujimingii]
MTALPAPVWPVLVLAAIQVADGILCIKPVGFIAACFTDVRFPRRYWRLMTPVKFAAALGLVAGIWIPYLGAISRARRSYCIFSWRSPCISPHATSAGISS